MRHNRWAVNSDGDTFAPGFLPAERLPAGAYSVYYSSQAGLVLSSIELSDVEILPFPDTAETEVVAEIENFWTKADVFERHGLPFKRGILLWGPPGSGKTTAVQQVARNVIARDGVVFDYSRFFMIGYRALREVEPERPLVVLMEDLDELLREHETDVLNQLDGVEHLHKVVFVASTNYPERLGERVQNRPSRFDRKVLVDFPSAESRRIYLEHLRRDGDEFDIYKWVQDTEGFSVAHMKELFVGCCILDMDYKAQLDKLRKMAEKAKSTMDFRAGDYM